MYKVFLNSDFDLVDEPDASLIKIVDGDGSVRFYHSKQEAAQAITLDDFQDEDEKMNDMQKAQGNPNHDEEGKFSSGNSSGAKRVTHDAIDGTHFETGESVSFTYMRNTQSAPKMSNDRFDQSIEPTGRYMNIAEYEGEKNLDAKGWEVGEVSFDSPLVVEWGATAGADGWKQKLSKEFGNKKGSRLSDAIRSAGYDAIVTIDTENNRATEIVDLKTRRDSQKAHFLLA